MTVMDASKRKNAENCLIFGILACRKNWNLRPSESEAEQTHPLESP